MFPAVLQDTHYTCSYNIMIFGVLGHYDLGRESRFLAKCDNSATSTNGRMKKQHPRVAKQPTYYGIYTHAYLCEEYM